MKRDDRKAALAAYKERKPAIGVYAVRHRPSGKTWVGHSPNLDKIQNRIWFMLRLGNLANHGLQSIWAASSEADFAFDILEQLDDEDLPYVRDALLKERLRHWQAKLNASVL
jgi:hypothetical protein